MLIRCQLKLGSVLLPTRILLDFDLKKYIMKERERRRKLHPSSTPSTEEDESDDGAVPTPDLEELVAHKRQLQAIVRKQQEKKTAAREEFLQWQTGQREKGQALRLGHLIRKDEGNKRNRCHALDSRLLQVEIVPPVPVT